LADRKRIELQLVNSRHKQPLLYYEYDEKTVNFTLFDRHMQTLEFSSEVVQEYKFNKDTMKIWNNFIKNIEANRSQH
jgi:IS1 family transposase